MSQKHPAYIILGKQKNREHQRLPIVPEFAEMLETVPARKRRGKVFTFPSQSGGELSFSYAKRVIAQFGQQAKVKTVGKKTATVHDFRRSFGSRMAMRVMPQVLQKLMRHADIQTTMSFYAHLDSDMIIASLYQPEKTGQKKLSK